MESVVGDFARECMGRAVFRQEGLYNSNKIAHGCYTRYHDVNKYICASITGRGAGFWPESNSQFGTNAIISS